MNHAHLKGTGSLLSMVPMYRSFPLRIRCHFGARTSSSSVAENVWNFVVSRLNLPELEIVHFQNDSSVCHPLCLLSGVEQEQCESTSSALWSLSAVQGSSCLSCFAHEAKFRFQQSSLLTNPDCDYCEKGQMCCSDFQRFKGVRFLSHGPVILLLLATPLWISLPTWRLIVLKFSHLKSLFWNSSKEVVVLHYTYLNLNQITENISLALSQRKVFHFLRLCSFSGFTPYSVQFCALIFP